MKEIKENNATTGYELDKDIEVDTLKLSIKTFISGVLLRTDDSLKVRSIEFLQGYLIADELLKDLDKGVKVLASKSDYYLAKTSLNYFTNYFNYCAERKIAAVGASDIGITLDDFIIGAITSYSMQKSLPNLLDNENR